MLAKTRAAPVDLPAPGVIPEEMVGPVGNKSAVDRDHESDLDAAPAFAASASDGETRRDRSRRKAHRWRLHGYAIAAVALVVFLIALASSNTAHVKLNWVFGTSHVSIVLLVLFAAIFGWLLGLFTTAAFHWRTRAPRRQPAARS